MSLAMTNLRIEVNTSGTTWTDVTGASAELTIQRTEGDVGSITVRVLDPDLDPTSVALLRFGLPMRVRAKEGSGWHTIFTGLVATLKVSHTPKFSIELTASDNVAYLANHPESRGVGTVDGLRWLMSGTGVAFSINGSSATLGAQTIVATNDSTSLWDQILIVRDSALGFAWVDQENGLVVNDADHMTATPVASVDAAGYSEIEIDFNADSLINSVTVNYLRYDIGNETTTEIPYGPYEDADSIATWGRYSATVTLQGVTEDPEDIEAYGEAVLARNSTGQVRAKSVTIPVNSASDIAVTYLDLGDVLTVTYPDGETEGDFRIIGVEHSIVPDPAHFGIKWLVTYTLDIPLALRIPSDTPGTGISVIPDNSVGTPQIQPGAVGTDEISFTVRDLDGTTTFYQSDQPTDAVEGDTWIDSDEGNKLYLYDGTDWTSVQDAAIVTAQATADGKNTVHYASAAPTSTTPGIPGDVYFVSIAGEDRITQQYGCTAGTGTTSGNTWVQKTLTNSMIANLDAGKITTGYIDAARIQAGTIDATMLTADAVDGKTIHGVTIEGAIITGTVQISSPTITGATITGATITGTVSITSPTITGANITGTSTITGAIVQTAAGGKRTVLDGQGSDKGLKFYDGTGLLACGMSATTSTFTIDSSTSTVNVEAYRFNVSTTGSIYGPINLTSGDAVNIKSNHGGAIDLDASGFARITTGSAYNIIMAAGANFLVGTNGNTSTYTMNLGTDGSVMFPRVATIGSSAATNVNFTSGGQLRMITSLRAAKVEIEDLPSPDRLLNVRACTWYDRREYEDNGNSADGLHRYPGVIAEELLDAGLDEFVMFGDDDKPYGVAYDRIGPALIPLIRDLTDRVAVLEGAR